MRIEFSLPEPDSKFLRAGKRVTRVLGTPFRNISANIRADMTAQSILESTDIEVFDPNQEKKYSANLSSLPNPEKLFNSLVSADKYKKPIFRQKIAGVLRRDTSVYLHKNVS